MSGFNVWGPDNLLPILYSLYTVSVEVFHEAAPTDARMTAYCRGYQAALRNVAEALGLPSPAPLPAAAEVINVTPNQD